MNLRRPIRNDRAAYATVAIFALVALVITLAIVNARSLAQLRREIRLIDEQQIERLAKQSRLIYTNLPPQSVNTQ